MKTIRVNLALYEDENVDALTAARDTCLEAVTWLVDRPLAEGKLRLAAKVIHQVARELMHEQIEAEKEADEPARGRGRPAGTPRVRHVYGADGRCHENHGGGECGAERKRKPRTGAAPAAPPPEVAE